MVSDIHTLKFSLNTDLEGIEERQYINRWGNSQIYCKYSCSTLTSLAVSSFIKVTTHKTHFGIDTLTHTHTNIYTNAFTERNVTITGATVTLCE